MGTDAIDVKSEEAEFFRNLVLLTAKNKRPLNTDPKGKKSVSYGTFETEQSSFSIDDQEVLIRDQNNQIKRYKRVYGKDLNEQTGELPTFGGCKVKCFAELDASGDFTGKVIFSFNGIANSAVDYAQAIFAGSGAGYSSKERHFGPILKECLDSLQLNAGVKPEDITSIDIALTSFGAQYGISAQRAILKRIGTVLPSIKPEDVSMNMIEPYSPGRALAHEALRLINDVNDSEKMPEVPDFLQKYLGLNEEQRKNAVPEIIENLFLPNTKILGGGLVDKEVGSLLMDAVPDGTLTDEYKLSMYAAKDGCNYKFVPKNEPNTKLKELKWRTNAHKNEKLAEMVAKGEVMIVPVERAVESNQLPTALESNNSPKSIKGKLRGFRDKIIEGRELVLEAYKEEGYKLKPKQARNIFIQGMLTRDENAFNTPPNLISAKKVVEDLYENLKSAISSKIKDILTKAGKREEKNR